MTEMESAALVDAISYHRARYTAGEPEISDEEFDNLVETLRAEAPGHPALSAVGAPLDRFDSPVEFADVMGSLESTRDPAVLSTWVSGISGDVLASLKIDGLALELQYSEGYLRVAATRGEGTVGKDVTLNALGIVDIPRHVQQPGSFRVRGEVYMTKTSLQAWNKANPQALLTNCRNAAVGSLRQRNASITAERKLSFFAYDVKDLEFDTEQAKYDWLQRQGFVTVPVFAVASATLPDFVQSIADARSALDYDIDGIVFSVADSRQLEALGYKDNCPIGKKVWKFSGLAAETVLVGVEWAVGKTGVVAPTGIVAPVTIGGVCIERVTLNNPVFIRESGLQLGSKVLIERANDVIPHVHSVLETPGEQLSAIEMPENCPCCGSTLAWRKSKLFCSSTNCSGQLISRLQNFCTQMHLKGFGRETLEQMVECERYPLNSLADLVSYPTDLLAELVGSRRALKLHAELIAAVADIPLAVFIRALGIPDVAERTAIALARALPGPDALLTVTAQDLKNVDGVKDKAVKIVMHLTQRREEIEALMHSVGISAHQQVQGVLTGKKVCVTGTRGNLEQLIKAAGGDYVNSLSKACDYLVVSAGGMEHSKVERARLLRIPTLSVEQFEAMVNVK